MFASKIRKNISFTVVEGFLFAVVVVAVAVVDVARLHKQQHIVVVVEKIVGHIVGNIDDTRCNPVGLLPREQLQMVDQRLESLDFLLLASHEVVPLPYLHVAGAGMQPSYRNLPVHLVSYLAKRHLHWPFHLSFVLVLLLR